MTSPEESARLEVGRLVSPGGFDPRILFEHSLGPLVTVEYVQIMDDAFTRDGWPMTLVTLRLMDSDGECELRLGASYKMTPWVGAALARVRTRAAYDALRPGLLDALVSARPDLWTAEPVCVADWWGPERT